jgi:hypothetical protein
MRRIGFSTGALARGDFRTALAELRRHAIQVVELSALRIAELDPLVSALPSLDLSDFGFVSIHAPSRFAPEEEPRVIERLQAFVRSGYPVVVHPNVIFNRSRWRVLGERLFIENMDKRKPVGRTTEELQDFFKDLPAARFCFDIGHARQVDPTMTGAISLLRTLQGRLAEIHMSEVNTASRHDPISANAVSAFSSVLFSVPEIVPIVLEPLIDQGQSTIETELQRARDVFAAVAPLEFASGIVTPS